MASTHGEDGSALAPGAAEVLRRMDALLAAAGRLGSREYDITLSAGVVERTQRVGR